MPIKANIMGNGQLAKSKDKECIFTRIKMCFRVIGIITKNMVMEPMSLMLLEWSILGNGIRISF